MNCKVQKIWHVKVEFCDENNGFKTKDEHFHPSSELVAIKVMDDIHKRLLQNGFECVDRGVLNVFGNASDDRHVAFYKKDNCRRCIQVCREQVYRPVINQDTFVDTVDELSKTFFKEKSE